MDSIYTIYSGNDNSIFSKLIRWRITPKGEKLFPYSHTGLILESDAKNITLDSLVTHSSYKDKGVNFTTLKTFIKHSTHYQINEFDEKTNNFNVMMEMAKVYEGTPYDLQGAIGLGVNLDWQIDTDFWCSEWDAFVLKNMNMSFLKGKSEHRIDPYDHFKWPQHKIDIKL